ncbi:MAG: hypothetical protein PVH61_27635 [Candidatus Aminicenantes bacterium]
MKPRLLMAFVLIFAAVTISAPPVDKEAQIACLQSILKNKVVPLGNYNNITGEEVLEKLASIKKQLMDCQLSEDAAAQDVIRDLADYINEAGGFRKNSIYTTRAKGYSARLQKKLENLVEILQKKPEAMRQDSESQEPSESKTTDSTSTLPQPDQRVGIFTGTQEKTPDNTWKNYISTFILGLIASFIGCAVVFFLFSLKRSTPATRAISRILSTELTKVSKRLGTIETDLRKAGAQNVEDLNERLLETDKNVEHEVSRVIELIKINDKEILNRLARLLQDTRTLEPKAESHREHNREQTTFQPQPQVETPSPRKKAEPHLPISGYPFDQDWKNEIYSTVEESKTRIKAFDATLMNFNMTNWLEEILKKFNEKSVHDEIAFFKEVLPRIKTLKEALTERQYHMFKRIFLDDFLEILGIEEFGKEGDLYDFNRHEVVGRIGEGGNDIRKIIMPGYKVKLSPRIISKASVKL